MLETYTYEEQKSHRKDWIKALRSGNYKQTIGSLKNAVEDVPDSSSYCCLGVACEVMGLVSELTEYGDNTYENQTTIAPHVVQIYFGLNSAEGDFYIKNGHSTSLVSLNDELGYDFNEIADVIEHEPAGLFKTDSGILW
jgi:hypothetical protein